MGLHQVLGVVAVAFGAGMVSALAVVGGWPIVSKPFWLFTRAIGTWATRTMRPGRDVERAQREVRSLRESLEIEKTNARNALAELDRVRENYRLAIERGAINGRELQALRAELTAARSETARLRRELTATLDVPTPGPV